MYVATRALLASALLIASASAAGTVGSVRPNVLLIYMDDLRVNDDGTEVTPSQDALRAGGVSFTQARTMVCMHCMLILSAFSARAHHPAPPRALVVMF